MKMMLKKIIEDFRVAYNNDDITSLKRISEIEIPPDILDFKVEIGYKSIDKINFDKILITKDNQAIVTATLNDENALYRKTEFILWKRDSLWRITRIDKKFSLEDIPLEKRALIILESERAIGREFSDYVPGLGRRSNS